MDVVVTFLIAAAVPLVVLLFKANCRVPQHAIGLPVGV